MLPLSYVNRVCGTHGDGRKPFRTGTAAVKRMEYEQGILTKDLRLVSGETARRPQIVPEHVQMADRGKI
jgi:hypothetical protein